MRKNRQEWIRSLTTIAATAIVLLILLVTTVPLTQWFVERGRAAELASNLELWETHGPLNYDFAIERRLGDGPPESAEFQVRDGQLAKIVDVAATAHAALPSTAIALFDAVRDGLEASPDAIAIRYDEDYGFPRELSIDPSRAVSGDESSLVVRWLVPARDVR